MPKMRNNTLIYGFWEKIEEACAVSGLTKAEITRRMGVDRKLLYGRPGMSCAMNSANLAKFCAITNVSADYLLGLKESMSIKEV